MTTLHALPLSGSPDRTHRDGCRSRSSPDRVLLVGGTRLTVRATLPSDRSALRAFYAALSEHSRYLRFLQPMPRIQESVLDLMLGPNHVSLIALDGDEVVAEALLVPPRPGSSRAEVAYTVTDRLHRQGIGRALVCRLLDHAVDLGICHVHAVMSPENRASAGLMRSFGARLRLEDGLLVAELPVCGERAAA
jgi:RimJ/RimL family protein N-acetyltransferase